MKKLKIKRIKPVIEISYECQVCGAQREVIRDKMDYDNNLLDHMVCTNCGKIEKFDEQTLKEIKKAINKIR